MVEIVGYIPVGVVGTHLDARIEKEPFGKMPVQEKADRGGIVVVRRGVRQVCNCNRVVELCSNDNFVVASGISKRNVGGPVHTRGAGELSCPEEQGKTDDLLNA